MKTLSWIAAGAALLLLAACGSVDDVNLPAAANEVPASATASPAAFTAYTGSLPPDEQANALDVETVVPPTSETTEPSEVA